MQRNEEYECANTGHVLEHFRLMNSENIITYL